MNTNTKLNWFTRFCPIYITENGVIKSIAVKAYETEELYKREIGIICSAFEEEKKAIKEAKRIAKIGNFEVGNLEYIGIVK